MKIISNLFNKDINEVFRINMSDMMGSFLTIARGYFSQLRNCEAEYNDTINGLILYYLSGFGDDVKLPRHLLNLCEDKDMLNYNLNNSHERHLQVSTCVYIHFYHLHFKN